MGDTCYWGLRGSEKGKRRVSFFFFVFVLGTATAKVDMFWHRTFGAQLSPSLRPEPGFFCSGLLLMSKLVKFHLAVQELVELGEGELTENTWVFFFLQVNAFFRYCFWSSLKTELLLCISTQIVIVCSCTGCEGRDEGQSWTWGRHTGLL